MEKITFETELNLYKVTSIEGVETYIVSVDFNDLHKDLVEAEIEPKSIKLLYQVYATKKIVGTK